MRYHKQIYYAFFPGAIQQISFMRFECIISLANGFQVAPTYQSEVLPYDGYEQMFEAWRTGPEQDQKFADALQRMWINFAKTGDPSIPGIEWPEFTKENWNVMVLDDGAKGGFRIDNTMLKDEMELALPLAKYRTMEAGL